MTKIQNFDDFNLLTSNITSFSHAYLFNVNNLEVAYPYIKEFAKKIICENLNEDEKEDIEYKINHDEYDDLYVVNPSSIGISTTEISKLLEYMQTKSLRPNGRRVYIIYGYERLSRLVSNKILKFLEEPNENIYALLITENMDLILSTIISRCQVHNLTFTIDSDNIVDYGRKMHDFLDCLMKKKNKTIAYINEYWQDYLLDRNSFFIAFNMVEDIISNTISYQCNHIYQDDLINSSLKLVDLDVLINILNKTNKLKNLIKQNINLNLLLDRYIIEVTKELNSCKK